MNSVLKALRKEARNLAAALPQAAFYRDLATEVAFAREMFFDHPLVLRLQEDVLPFLYDEYAHGIDHAKKVAVDAAAICLKEGSDPPAEDARRLALLAQFAGLLHDSCRLEADHALRGAETVRIILRHYPVSDRDREMVAHAVADHEAFKPRVDAADPEAALLAGALYDADKFRWGPDNFSTTLWEICDYEDWPLEEIVRRFPRGLEIIGSVAGTFRTATGRTYGPELIEQGISLGRTLYQRLQQVAAAPDPERAAQDLASGR